jgi:hypothetical protein
MTSESLEMSGFWSCSIDKSNTSEKVCQQFIIGTLKGVFRGRDIRSRGGWMSRCGSFLTRNLTQRVERKHPPLLLHVFDHHTHPVVFSAYTLHKLGNEKMLPSYVGTPVQKWKINGGWISVHPDSWKKQLGTRSVTGVRWITKPPSLRLSAVVRTVTDPVFCCSSGLPDGFFSNQKSRFGQILEGLRCDNVDLF